jgi:hypothetical protein
MDKSWVGVLVVTAFGLSNFLQLFSYSFVIPVFLLLLSGRKLLDEDYFLVNGRCAC